MIALRTGKIQEIQPQRVGNHAEAGKAHGGGAQHGAELNTKQRNQRAGGYGNANAVVEELKVDIGDVSVAFEEVSRSNWGEQVYKKEIKDNPNVCLKPNYEYE